MTGLRAVPAQPIPSGTSCRKNSGREAFAAHTPGGIVEVCLQEELMPTAVRVDDLDVARGAGALVLDVRESDEHTAGHVPGATLLPLGVPARPGAGPAADRAGVRRAPERRPQCSGR